jgi:hypothetical protein
VTPPKARTFQVATRRFRSSWRAGMVSSSAVEGGVECQREVLRKRVGNRERAAVLPMA